jgi:hypothetical protein
MIGSVVRRVLAIAFFAAAIAVPMILNPVVSAAAPDEQTHGHALPPARSAQVNPHQLPPLAPTGDTSEQIHAVPQRFPVDAGTYSRLKASANADASQRDHGLQGTLAVTRKLSSRRSVLPARAAGTRRTGPWPSAQPRCSRARMKLSPFMTAPAM